MNLNDFATIVLTKRGAEVLNADHRRMAETFPRKGITWKTDYKEGDVYKNILWLILNIFSECFENGDHPPFTDLEKME